MLDKYAQVVMTVAQIVWCRACETAIRAENPRKAFDEFYQASGTRTHPHSTLAL